MSIYRSIIERIRNLHLTRRGNAGDSSYGVNNPNVNKKHFKITKKRFHVDTKTDLLNKEIGAAFSEYKNIQLSRYK